MGRIGCGRIWERHDRTSLTCGGLRLANPPYEYRRHRAFHSVWPKTGYVTEGKARAPTGKRHGSGHRDGAPEAHGP